MAITVAVVAGGLLIGLPDLRRSVDKTTLLLLGALAFLPSILLFLLTVFTDFGLWTLRYRMAYVLGVVLLVAMVIEAFGLARDRRLALIAVMLIGLLMHEGEPQAQDWRGALAFAEANVSDDRVLVIAPGFVEASSIEQRQDPELAAFVAAPVAKYPVTQDVVVAPSLPAGVSFQYILESVRSAGAAQVAIVYLAGGISSYEALGLYFRMPDIRRLTELFGISGSACWFSRGTSRRCGFDS